MALQNLTSLLELLFKRKVLKFNGNRLEAQLWLNNNLKPSKQRNECVDIVKSALFSSLVKIKVTNTPFRQVIKVTEVGACKKFELSVLLSSRK